MSEHSIILEARNLTKCFPAAGGRLLKACDQISLYAERGKTLGIVGESGCGKSTFVRMLTQMEQPTSGEIYYNGQEISQLKGEAIRQNHRKIQMIFQNPSQAVSPKMKVATIVTEPLLNYGLIDKKEVRQKATDLLEQVGLDATFLDRYPHHMSGGQLQRVSIARALSLSPEILICDEATAALDVSIQEKIIRLLTDIQKQSGITILFICHDLALVASMSHTVAIMYLGNIVEIIPGDRLRDGVCHPYTRALFQSVFSLHAAGGQGVLLEGEVPSPLDVPKGCPFSGRCPKCQPRCLVEKPRLKKTGDGHKVACHRV